MYHMILLVLDNRDQCPSVLDAWEAVGASGITILESTGLGRVRRAGALRDDIPLMPSLASLLRQQERHHRTLFTVVEGEAMVDRVVEATLSIVGDLNEPDNGILFVLPVSRVVGLKGAQERARKHRAGRPAEED
jgi:nitrogen regulatory protein PII